MKFDLKKAERIMSWLKLECDSPREAAFHGMAVVAALCPDRETFVTLAATVAAQSHFEREEQDG